MTDYRSTSNQLEKILAEMESGDLDVDQAIKYYQAGMDLVKELEKQLKLAENKITKVKIEK